MKENWNSIFFVSTELSDIWSDRVKGSITRQKFWPFHITHYDKESSQII
jgi:hypothetical protein